MQALFKEKTYEKYFGHELARKTNITYSPDQCDEASLGFDEAFHLPPKLLAELLPHMRHRRKPRLHGHSMSEFDFVGDELSKRLPLFKFNLFVQYKRPDYISRSDGKEFWSWKKPYFRFDTTSHQQLILEKVSQQSLGRSATVYAAPAFWKSKDLFDNARNGIIVGQSNIVMAERLRGHSRFSYCQPGHLGKGHSDPVDIESSGFDRILSDGLLQEGLQFNIHIKRAAKQIEEAAREVDDCAQLLGLARSLILDGFEDLKPDDGPSSFSYAIATVRAFSEAFDISYYAIG